MVYFAFVLTVEYVKCDDDDNLEANGNDLISFNIKNDNTKSTLTHMYIELVNQQRHQYEYENKKLSHNRILEKPITQTFLKHNIYIILIVLD